MSISTKPWTRQQTPKRILAIRLQAMGDVAITLPYLQALRNNLPKNTQIDLLTRKEVDAIPRSIFLFDNIYSIGGKRNFKKQFIYCVLLLPKILWRRYDVVIDLQNNLISKLVRKITLPEAWSEFDRFSQTAAGERTRQTIEKINLCNIQACINFTIRNSNAENILLRYGWNETDSLIIINPAGAFKTRNWAIENYASFMQLWLSRFPRTQFLILGIELIATKADYLKNIFTDKLINLVNKTNAAEAFAIVQKAKFVLSEDSGLMHFAWVSGIPTLALFGSTKSDWSTPLGNHTKLLSSSDLSCGNCLLENCKFGDTHCLTRYTPEFVFESAMNLLSSISSGGISE